MYRLPAAWTPPPGSIPRGSHGIGANAGYGITMLYFRMNALNPTTAT